jgi:hypothetical protein
VTRWTRKVRRRRPGIYAYRTRRHLRPGTEWGYVGKSNRLDLRDGQHADKGWRDLMVRRYILIKLPWWLGWDWVLLPLETLVILLLLPRYNWQKNPRIGKVGPRGQKIQRLEREQARPAHLMKVRAATLGIYALRGAVVLMIITGLGGYLWNR